MKHKEVNPEVLVAENGIVQVAPEDIAFLKSRLATAPRKRIRFCAHRSSEESLHEMIIALKRGTYIRPHKHMNKVESFHIIEGAVDVVIFEDNGSVIEVVELGDYSSGKNFYYRLSAPRYHTLILRSEILVIHETTNGPFNRADTIFAPWSPEEGDEGAIMQFTDRLLRDVIAV